MPIVDHSGGGYDLVGEAETYPLTPPEIKDLDPSVIWNQRHSAVGSVIGNDQIDLVLGLHTSAKLGNAMGSQIVYSSAGHTYRVLVKAQMQLVQPGGHCNLA